MSGRLRASAARDKWEYPGSALHAGFLNHEHWI